MSKTIKLNEENYNFLLGLVREQYNSTIYWYKDIVRTIKVRKELVESGEYRPQKKTIKEEEESLSSVSKLKEQIESLVQELGITIEN